MCAFVLIAFTITAGDDREHVIVFVKGEHMGMVQAKTTLGEFDHVSEHFF